MDRLDKFISSQLPEISRAKAKELIRRGEVKINGALVREPETKLDPAADTVSVSGRDIGYKEHLYIMLNKPAGVVSATRDGLSETVTELLPSNLRRPGLFPAGRLDKDAVGFLLITDDGPLAHRLLSPKFHVPKKYLVRLRDPVPDGCEARLQEIVLDGERVKPSKLEITGEKECLITVSEGRYHQIKRMFSALSNEVVYLKRVEFAGIPLDSALREGECRELSSSETSLLKNREKQAQKS